MSSNLPPRLTDLRLRLGGVACVACTDLIEHDLKNLAGVHNVSASYTLRRAFLQIDATQTSGDALIKRIEKLGYHAYPEQQFEVSANEKKQHKRELLRLLIALLLFMQSMMFMYPFYTSGETEMTAGEVSLMKWASLVLILPVMLFCATPIFKGAWAELRLRRLGMDTPVAFAIVTAFVASVYSTVAQVGHIYFDSISMFVALLLSARYIQYKALNQAAMYLNEVLTHTQRFAEKVASYPQDKSIELLPAQDLKVGDVLYIGSGETVAADAELIEGTTACSQALLTGESQPVIKSVGDTMLAGSMNIEQGVYARVIAERGASELDAIERLAEKSALHKPAMAKIVEVTARYFLYGLLMICAVAAVYWYTVDASRVVPVVVAILIITCPCALALAVPTVLTAATSALARRHVLVVQPEALEKLAKVSCYAFDKTGTLTEDVQTLERTMLTDAATADGWNEHEALQIAATLENASRHPIALALRKSLQAVGLPERMDELSELNLTVGQGVIGVINGHRYRIGKPTFASAQDLELPESRGKSVALLALDDGTPIAWFLLSDQVRPHAQALITALKQKTKVMLISGDKADVVEPFAAALNIEHVYSDATPSDKLARIIDLQKAKHIVAMTGDGLNDAPVLKQADVALAMGHGSGLAQMQADMIVQSGSLDDVYAAHVIALRARRLTWQNLAWALLYNGIAIPLAVMGAVTPLVASIGMAVSSLIVVGNSLRVLNPIKDLD